MELDFDKQGGLIPAIVQDGASRKVLMLGFMNQEAFEMTLKTGNVAFYSRSRNKLWIKGETSGHFLKVQEIRKDCDSDALLILAEPIGPGVCHEGYESCFFRKWDGGAWTIADEKAYDEKEVYAK